MIAYLTGTAHAVQTPHITLVANGIGFLVTVPSNVHATLGGPLELAIYTHVTQDQGMQLFGFASSDERHIFSLIIACSGIGPKIGLAILGALSPALFVSAVLSGDVRAFHGIDGVGPKKAESLIMQLKDKIGKLSLSPEFSQTPTVSSIKQLSEVLASLGYSRAETSACLEHLKKEGWLEHATFDALLRKGLAFFAKKSTAG